jgi:hypothetical protein
VQSYLAAQADLAVSPVARVGRYFSLHPYRQHQLPAEGRVHMVYNMVEQR